jgi:hypothetical protein
MTESRQEGSGMSEDEGTEEEQGSLTPEAPDPAEGDHDDIMKRLLDYQRHLRGGAEPKEAAATAWPSVPGDTGDQTQAPTATSDLVDLSGAEPEIEPIEDLPAEAEVGPPQPIEGPGTDAQPATRTGSDAAARIAELEGTLDRLGGLLGGLRQSFQDLAVAADARLAAIEDEIAGARDRRDEDS